jgi:hypothetical protein
MGVRKMNDISYLEDSTVLLTNLIALEEHLFFTAMKNKDDRILNILNDIRNKRTKLQGELEGIQKEELHCSLKHILSSAIRYQEVGTRFLYDNNLPKAKEYFKNSFDLYTLALSIIMEGQKNKSNKKENKPTFLGKLKKAVLG